MEENIEQDESFLALAIRKNHVTTKSNSPDLHPDLFEARTSIEEPFRKLLERIDSIEDIKDDMKALVNLLDECKNLSDFYDATQISTKLLANGLYGAVGAKFFRYYMKSVAADITAEGRNATKMMDIRTTEYLKSPNGWASEIDFFNRVKVEFSDIITATELKPIVFSGKYNKGAGVYGDTDSVFFTIKPMLDSLGVSENADSFRVCQLCVDICVNPIAKIQDELLKRYAVNRNCEHKQVFELEAILRRTIHLAKKKYVGSYFWKDGKFLIDDSYDKTPNAYKNVKLKTTGVELAQKSTPLIIKNFLKKYVYLMLSSKNVSDKMYFKMAYAMTKEFIGIPIERYAKARALNTFNNYHDINSDGEYFAVGGDKASRGCIWYNNEVISRGLEQKYPLIAQGSRIKHYVTKDGLTFSYPIDDDCSFPTEFAPEPNVRENLDKMLFKPLSRIMCKVTDADLSMLGSQQFQNTFSLFE